MVEVNRIIVSFKDIPQIAAKSARSVLLLRHSFRESLQEGGLDPGLTVEGWNYAEKCGKLLSGMRDVCFGASPRKRTVQTVEAMIKGGDLAGEYAIVPCPRLFDTVMFSPPEKLQEAISDQTLTPMLEEYFSTGSASGMIDMAEFAGGLLDFLTGDGFVKPNVILASHDVIIAALLLHFKVYPFELKHDWCGYVQGAFLYQDKSGVWTISYAVPDRDNRELYQLFI